MKRMSIALLAGLLTTLAAWAEVDLQDALTDDVVLRALADEIERSIAGLKIEDLERPYFIEYGLMDATGAYVSAELGAVTNRNEMRQRVLRTDVRVGSYELDNTNFSSGYGGYWGHYFGRMGSTPLPIEDDYNAIRQAIWWATDQDYKQVVETFVKKKAFMESKLIEDKPPDFSHEEPTVHIEEQSDVSIDRDWLEQTALELSALFRAYPDIQDSDVTVSGAAGNKYLVNTEGTRLRIAGSRWSVLARAEVQAEDGMELSDSLSIEVRDLDDLPTMAELKQKCREMIERLIAIKNAPRMADAYTGPVLFEPEAATAIFAAQFGSRFAGGQRPVGSRTRPDDFANKLNRRILPRFMNVVDDPTRERIADRPALGHYEYDDQGVPAQRVVLVEKGQLKALLMSRNPSKEFGNSNGHGRGFFNPSAAAASLLVTAEPALTPEELREELIEACRDEGLEYGIRIAALGGSNAGYYGGSGTGPLAMYKVYTDGREELVRGAEIARIDLKAFKRMLAAGDTPHVQNASSRAEGRTAVAPAMLFEELDLAKTDRDFDKPPILPTPLARE